MFAVGFWLKYLTVNIKKVILEMKSKHPIWIVRCGLYRLIAHEGGETRSVPSERRSLGGF